MHIGKYVGYIFNGAIKILFYPLQTKKYLKNKDKYTFEERYNFVRGKACEVLDKILKIKLNIEGIEKINMEENYLFVPNHQGLLDPASLLKLIEHPTIFVSKKEAANYPIVGKIEKVIDSVFLDRSSVRDALTMSKACKQHLLDKKNVVIFAEGTRSKNEEKSIGEYKPGAFKCAYGTGVKIVPVVIDKSYIPLSTKIKNTDKVIDVAFLNPIESSEYENLNTTDLANKVESLAKLKLEEMRKRKK